MGLDVDLNCFWAKEGRCRHPRIAGEATAERCGPCVEYRGPLRGFGDVVAAVTKATGVDVAVKAVVGDCNCPQRREMLNQKFPLK